MLEILLGSVIFTLAAGFLCSLAEGTFYAIPKSFPRELGDEGDGGGPQALVDLLTRRERTVTALLIVHLSVVVTGGIIAGWTFGALYGERYGVLGVAGFIAGFVALIVVAGEVLPKALGTVFCRTFAPLLALPVRALLAVAGGPLWLMERCCQRFSPSEGPVQLSGEDILSQVDLGREEGALDHLEGSVIRNVIDLDKLLVRDVLTPRIVVFRLPEETPLRDLTPEIFTWSHSRVPVFEEQDPDHLTGYVLQRDIYRELLRSVSDSEIVSDLGIVSNSGGNESATLKSLARTLPVVPEFMRVDKLLLKMFAERTHICSVVDEHGGLAGIITLEDIIEELVGQEIVDEYDTVSDLRTFAKILRVTRARRMKGGRGGGSKAARRGEGEKHPPSEESKEGGSRK